MEPRSRNFYSSLYRNTPRTRPLIMCQVRKGIELTDSLGGSSTFELPALASGRATGAIPGTDFAFLGRSS